MQYLVILFILIFAAGVVYHANVYPSHTIAGPSNIEYWRTWSILQIPYWQVYGELFMDTLEGFTSILEYFRVKLSYVILEVSFTKNMLHHTKTLFFYPSVCEDIVYDLSQLHLCKNIAELNLS